MLLSAGVSRGYGGEWSGCLETWNEEVIPVNDGIVVALKQHYLTAIAAGNNYSQYKILYVVLVRGYPRVHTFNTGAINCPSRHT